MNNTTTEQPYKRNDKLPSIMGDSVDEVVEKIRTILLEKEKAIPEGVPHTLRIWLTPIQWNYLCQ